MVRKRTVHHHSPSVEEKNRKPIYTLVIILFAVIVLCSFFNALRTSLFFSSKDRINFVLYGKDSSYYSLGIKGAGNYAILFPAEMKLQIPGGYGYYKVGALGKLIGWDKKPELLKRTFSLATFSFTDYYFYSDADEVFSDSSNRSFTLPTVQTLLFSPSNVGVLDRIYLSLWIPGKKQTEFKEIPVHTEKNQYGDSVFAAEQFEKKYTGYLFQQSYRNERASVQVIYSNKYVNADRIAQLLEGNGIRVGDISVQSEDEPKVTDCEIVEDKDSASATATVLQNFFHCHWKKGKTDLYDILFKLGDREEDWEVQ